MSSPSKDQALEALNSILQDRSNNRACLEIQKRILQLAAIEDRINMLVNDYSVEELRSVGLIK